MGKRKKEKPPFQSKWKEIIISIVIILILYTLGALFWKQIIHSLRQIPVMEVLYQMATAEINRRSVIGLSIATLFGSLFFVAYPPEMFFLIYYKLGYPFLYLVVVMTFWMLIGQLLNYSFGYYIEKKIVYRFVKENKAEFKSSLKRYDALFIVVINILPLPADVLCLFLGMVRYDFKKMLIYTVIGRVLKFFFIWLLLLLVKGVWSP